MNAWLGLLIAAALLAVGAGANGWRPAISAPARTVEVVTVDEASWWPEYEHCQAEGRALVVTGVGVEAQWGCGR